MVSNVSVHTYRYCIQDTTTLCKLKYMYEDLKNGDCLLTYPNLKEKQKQIDVVYGSGTIYNSIQIEQVKRNRPPEKYLS